MKRNEDIALLAIFVGLIIGIVLMVFSFLETLFWEYPKKCIFFELDFSGKCWSDTFNNTIEGNRSELNETIEDTFNDIDTK